MFINALNCMKLMIILLFIVFSVFNLSRCIINESRCSKNKEKVVKILQINSNNFHRQLFEVERIPW